jgi:NhaA family Na+:H+ antiporter
MIAVGCLAGIGFTMALFIAGLALAESMLDTAKIGVLGGSAFIHRSTFGLEQH